MIDGTFISLTVRQSQLLSTTLPDSDSKVINKKKLELVCPLKLNNFSRKKS
jgi:hypothetical protein